jgi:hypothetical protein
VTSDATVMTSSTITAPPFMKRKMSDVKNTSRNVSARTPARIHPSSLIQASAMCMITLPRIDMAIRLYSMDRRISVLSDCTALTPPCSRRGASLMMFCMIWLYVSPLGAFFLRSLPSTRNADVGPADRCVLVYASAFRTSRRYEHICDPNWSHFMWCRMLSRMSTRTFMHAGSMVRFVAAWHCSVGHSFESFM